MKTRFLGNGLKTSEIGIGCMGLNHHRGPAKDRNEMISVIHAAVDLGVTMLDTAEVYGPYTNEELVGDALVGRRDKVLLATKGGHKFGDPQDGLDSRPESIRKALEGSLRRLKTDYIDLYYIHRVDPKVPIEDVALAMQQFKKEGKIRHWGLSEAGSETIRSAHAVEPLTAVQNEYSMWWRTVETTLFPTLEELGIGMVAYSPLGRGYLTGKLDKNMSFSINDNRAELPRFTKEAMEANQVVIDYIEKLAMEKQATPAQIALAWVLAQKPWIVPIPGTTRIERIQENNASAEIIFTESELKQINNALSKMKIVGDRYPASQQNKIGR
ncbi:aldo/keto reductase [Paenibacillus prosopidis]|uniref:Aryl-alcohol dehydrogenase-like predicted oxidoreductase n=1 Tax=Paenibacillus prosopidis TaxID=630520 RepID=A0A368VIK0_9BACL|nr:aldo/keto reductase [Paenibacillus prosopidis]RCW41115.1 aryl-alcohol dehydrogenase-like predicted oxidoreductase [Paenibacillus prosopidis]